MWTEVKLREVGYVDEEQDFLINTVIDDEVEVLESEIVMTIDKAGRSTLMACGIMVVKSIQGRACFKLLRVLYNYGGSKSVVKTNILHIKRSNVRHGWP